MAIDDDLPFKVVKDLGAHDELMALAANLPIGQGAFGAAARLYADETVELRQGARVVLSSIHEIGKPMDTAPRTGERILLDAELQFVHMENAINDWVFARWDEEAQWWRLSPHAEGTSSDSVNGWLPVSFLPSRR
jgi:hypothetical protein